MTYFEVEAEVVARGIDGGATLLRLAAGDIAAAAKPFQFVMLRVPGEDRILRRPFSVFAAGEGYLEVLIRCVGAGTARLCEARPGDAINLTGPFGLTIDLPAGACFVAGGVGVAGIAYAVTDASRRGSKPRVYFGARGADQLPALKRLQGAADLTIVTDDGSAGERGLVSDFVPADAPAVVACGPLAMFAALRRRLGDGAELYVMMEERMACGVGACRSCAVPAAGAAGGYVAACQHGPLLAARDLDWERLEETG